MNHRHFLGERRYAVRAALAVVSGIVLSTLGPSPLGQAAAAPTATITGHVQLQSGMDRFHDGVVLVENAATGRTVSGAFSRTDGSYSVGGLPAGTYRVVFNRLSGLSVGAAQFYNGHAEHEGVAAADLVTLDSAQVVEGVDAAIVRGGSVSGTLVNGVGDPLEGCLVQAFTPTDDLVTRIGVTSAKGHFSVGGLSSGDYHLRVVAGRGACLAGTQVFAGDGVPLTPDPEDAAAVATVLGEDATIASPLVYDAGATLRGTVTLPSGASGYGSRVAVLRDADTGRFVAGTRIRAGGDYSFSALAAGSYRLAFNRLSGYSQLAAEFYDDKAEGLGAGSAEPIVVEDDETVVADAALAWGGTLGGQLVNEQGLAYSDCLVQAVDPRTATLRFPGASGKRHLVTRAASTGYDGSFSIQGLSTGDYLLRVAASSGCGFGPQYYVGGHRLQYGDSGGVKIHVTQGHAVSVGHIRPGTATDPVLNVARPAVSGRPQVGRLLSASSGTWSPADVAVAYQWRRNGAPIPGATGPTYLPVPTDAGAAVTVMVTATRVGRSQTGTSESLPVRIGLGVLDVAGPTKIQLKNGKAHVGQKLTAVPSRFPPGTRVAYQWLRDGKAIKRATHAAYQVVKKDKGTRLSVRVTYAKAGYATVTRVSPATKKVTG